MLIQRRVRSDALFVASSSSSSSSSSCSGFNRWSSNTVLQTLSRGGSEGRHMFCSSVLFVRPAQSGRVRFQLKAACVKNKTRLFQMQHTWCSWFFLPKRAWRSGPSLRYTVKVRLQKCRNTNNHWSGCRTRIMARRQATVSLSPHPHKLAKQKLDVLRQICNHSATLMKHFCNSALWPWQVFVFSAALPSSVASR